ncbi:MAG TPA: tripartite tricarboxylate transporter permease [Burkholderiales bacterium]|nr:tripartite tricarboxylate transporter permease [Burkholderiales bacterium]
MFELLGAGLAGMFHVKYLVPLFLGTLIGVVGGALPGITITMTVIVVLPFTFGLEPLQGLACMIGVYVGGETGGLITSCLLGIPGKPSAVATTFDGFPMARKGEPGRALWLGIWASILGGLLGAIVLVAATGPLAQLALKFGPWEYFALFVLALSMVAGLVESSLVKGLLSGALGCVVTVLGNDPVMGQPRLTLGISWLEGGIPFLPVLIGVFAFSQIMSDLERFSENTSAALNAAINLTVSHAKVLAEILTRPFLLLWSTFIGLVIGVLPAIGGSAANMLAYDQAKKFSQRPEKFGSGIPEGIIASEASNNANVAGSLVTIMAFGIPGDAVTAVMLGALTIHGIQSGPLFISQNAPLAYGMFAAYILAHPLVLILLFFGVRWVLRIVIVPKSILFPVVLVLCVVGAYALGNSMAIVYVLLVFGLLGYLMVKFGFPLAPFILGVILGDQIEINLVRSLMTDSDLWLFVTRPISALLLGAAVASIALSIWQHRRTQKKSAVASDAADF